MKKNNKGLSLVELLIAFAVLAVVSGIMLGFITSGSRMHRSVSAEVGVQLNAQMAVAQVHEYIIDCNRGLCFSGNTLYVVNAAESGTGYDVHLFRYTAADSTLEYACLKDQTGDAAPSLDSAVYYLLADDVSYFNIDLGSGTVVSSVAVDIHLTAKGKTSAHTQTIAPRNKPLRAADFATLWSAIVAN